MSKNWSIEWCEAHGYPWLYDNSTNTLYWCTSYQCAELGDGHIVWHPVHFFYDLLTQRSKQMESGCELVKLGKLKHKGIPSKEWFKHGKLMLYCFGYKDQMTDELLPECARCEKQVSRADGDLREWLKEQTTARKGENNEL